MTTALGTGHEGTTSTITWLLYELARYPEYQSKIREEVRATRARVTKRGDSDFSVSDLDSMTFCIAAMKEVLRLHPNVYTLWRCAGRDDVIPLAYPITLSGEEVVNEIPVPKGTEIVASIWGYNRCVEDGTDRRR